MCNMQLFIIFLAGIRGKTRVLSYSLFPFKPVTRCRVLRCDDAAYR